METEESRDLEAEAAELEERERTLEARKRDLEAEKKALRAEAASLEGAEVKSKKPDKVTLVSVSNVEEEEINWLYPPYVPRGKITLCAAYPGTGKTYLLCYMAACVSTGRSFFNLIPFKDEPGKVIYLTSEDGIGDTIKKRLRICGANTDNVFTVPDGQNNLLFDSPEIEEFIKQIKPALMIFDPFQSYIGKEVVGLEEPTQPKKNASGMKYAKIREIRNQLERCRYVVMSAEAKIKRVEPLSQEFEQTVQLIQDTKEQVNNLVWQELRCKEELRAEEQQERKQDPQWVNE